ncbi:unnamed protein product, partial [Laminaria digitata]
EAAQDCRASVGEDPGNAKALVRWGLCEEALGRWQGALQHFERACALLPQGTALRKTGLDGKRRAGANATADSKVAHAEAMPQELVHRGQMLRLSLGELLPTECRPGAWFHLSIGLSNEFGLWRRSDFPRPSSSSSVTEPTTQGTQPLPAFSSSFSSCSACSSSGRPSLPCSCPSPGPFSTCLEESEEGWKASSGAGTTKSAGKLRLVVEARHLEGFGGRSEAGWCGPAARDDSNAAAGRKTACWWVVPPQTASAPPITTSARSAGEGGKPAQILPAEIAFAENDKKRTACSCVVTPQTSSTPPITSVRSAGEGGEEPSQMLPSQGFVENDGRISARGAGAGLKGSSSRWVVETDGGSTIGPEGKVTLRVRFVAAPECSGGRGRGGGSCAGGGGGSSVCCDVGGGGASEERFSECSGRNEITSERSGRGGSIGQVVLPRSSGVGSGGATRDRRPLLMLLRVSVVEDEAMALLGRRVVPVLSLPIAVSEADPRTQHTRDTQFAPGVEVLSTEQTEQTEQSALATSAFNAGAINCREVVFRVVPA